jgi:hypothetical protein
VRRNIFAQGSMGLSLVAEQDSVPRQCEIAHNTWHNVGSWIVWTGPVPAPARLRIYDNLLVGADTMAVAARTLAAGLSDPPVFQNNGVFMGGRTAIDFEPAATVLANFPLLSLDPAHADYLKPDFARLRAENGGGRAIPGRYFDPDASE